MQKYNIYKMYNARKKPLREFNFFNRTQKNKKGKKYESV